MIPLKLRAFFRRLGLTRDLLDIPHYYLPYFFSSRGRAWAPTLLSLELTYHCNLKCEMCPLSIYQQRNQPVDEHNRMRMEDWTKVIADYAAMGGKRLKITGGEPFLIKHALDLAAQAESLGLETTILSNATLIDAELARRIVGTHLHHLVISIDGDKDAHDRIRGQGIYEQTIAGAQNLIDARQAASSRFPRMHANFALTATNQDKLTQAIRDLPFGLFETMVVNRIFYTTETKLAASRKLTGQAWAKAEDWLLPKSLCEFSPDIVKGEFQTARTAAREKGISLLISPVLGENDFDRQIRYDPPAFVRQCFHPWFASRIDPLGNVYPCVISTTLGNVREKSFPEVWNDTPYCEFRKLIRRRRLLPICTACCILNRPHWNKLPLRKFPLPSRPANE